VTLQEYSDECQIYPELAVSEFKSLGDRLSDYIARGKKQEAIGIVTYLLHDFSSHNDILETGQDLALNKIIRDLDSE
jgi:hypothetical protein